MHGFNITRVATTAATDINPAHYVIANLSAGASAAVLSVYNGATTAAASKIMEISVAASTSESVDFPHRATEGRVRVVLSHNAAEAFIGVA